MNTLIDELNILLESELFPGGPTYTQAIANRLIKKARLGDVRAVELIVRLVEGENQADDGESAEAVFARLVDLVTPYVERSLDRGYTIEAIKKAFAKTYQPAGIIAGDLDNAIDHAAAELTTV